MTPTNPVLLLVLVAALWGSAGEPAHADSIQTFALDGSGSQSLSGSKLVVTLDDIEVDGVTFDAVLTVLGSSSLTQTSRGLGVSGGGSGLLNNGESLSYSLAIQDVSDGVVAFGGFTALAFSYFGPSAEKAVFSVDGSLSTTGDNFLTATAPGDPSIATWSPAAFSLFGKDAGGITTSFRVDAVNGSFSASSAVPEPGSLGLVAFGAALVGLHARRRRRKRRYLGGSTS